MGEHFFLNYGGPSVEDYDESTRKMEFFIGSDNLDLTKKLDEACKEFYTRPVRTIQYNIKGIDVKVYTYGVHRALSLDIPDNASAETKKAFEEAREVASNFYDTRYKLLGNNCVTAVSKTLNCLDSRLTPANMIWPWNLDRNLKNYCKYYPENTVAGSFITKYTEITNRESFSLIRSRHWQEKTIDSDRDILAHAYKSNQGERTKSTLIELGWVTEDKNHMLQPTELAPPQFSTGLKKFNEDYEKMLGLKKLYQNEASVFSRKATNFFKDNPSYEIALKRLEQRAAENPGGASAKVLERLREAPLNIEKTDTKKIDTMSNPDSSPDGIDISNEITPTYRK